MTHRFGSIREFMKWSKQVIRRPKTARGKPKRWYDNERTAQAARRRAARASPDQS